MSIAKFITLEKFILALPTPKLISLFFFELHKRKITGSIVHFLMPKAIVYHTPLWA